MEKSEEEEIKYIFLEDIRRSQKIPSIVEPKCERVLDYVVCKGYARGYREREYEKVEDYDYENNKKYKKIIEFKYDTALKYYEVLGIYIPVS